MTDVTTAALRPQHFFSLSNIYSALVARTSPATAPLSTTNRAADLLSGVAACALVVASAGFGATYAWSTGHVHGPVLGSLSVLFAVALDVCKPLALRNAITALSELNLIRASALAILACTAVAYSITAELSLWSALRSDGIAHRQSTINATTNTAKDKKRIDDRYETANTELKAIAPARTPAEVKAEITKLFAANPKAGDCSELDGRVSRSICPQVEALNAEAARGERREALKKEMEEAASASATATTPPPTTDEVTTADPGATALATYLLALGFSIPVNTLSEWLALIPVLALEIGSLFAGLLVSPSPRAPLTPRASKRSLTPSDELAETPANTPRETVFNEGVQCVHSASERLSVSDDPSERLVDLLRKAGGEVFGGQRSFAKATGISPAHVNGLLHDLKAAGRVALDAGKNGTRVRLVA